MAQNQQLRGRPIYIETGKEVISLVPEAVQTHGSTQWLRGGYSGQLAGTAVYVIDAAGVRKVVIRNAERWSYISVAVGMLAMWLQYIVLRRVKHG